MSMHVSQSTLKRMVEVRYADDRVISVIREYAERYEQAPVVMHRYFRIMSHYKWACDELINRTFGKSLDESISIIEEFSTAMEDLEHVNRYNELMFTVGKQVASNILDILKAMQ